MKDYITYPPSKSFYLAQRNSRMAERVHQTITVELIVQTLIVLLFLTLPTLSLLLTQTI